VSALVQFWKRFEPAARWRVGVGVLVIVIVAIWLSYRALRVDYAVLFTQLADSDAATIVDQLKRQKIPYRLADGGATVEVPSLQVHETRLRLMSSGVPLSGGLGFEIFDKQGLGATEQSQKVSYQRALQGELARTIATLEGVRQARVHLVLPESSLFRRDRQEARAAVTLTMNRGAALGREQILGVQRLVAASVAGLETSRVVVTDQRGITLSGPDSLGGDSTVSERHLAMKREVEEYITRKVARLLDSTYGPGQAIVSVDVSLNFDEIRRTVQDAQPSGVRRRRQVLSGTPLDEAGESASVVATEPAASGPGNSSTEVEYEYGRKVEQVISAPGGIARLSVGIVVPGDIASDEQQRITDLVRMAAGVNDQRGDAIVVQPLDQLGVRRAAPEMDVEQVGPTATSSAGAAEVGQRDWLTALVPDARYSILIALAAIALLFVASARRRLTARARAAVPRSLTPEERQNVLLEIEKALEASSTSSRTRTRS
jgi:flagellar M-ring protein FliF